MNLMKYKGYTAKVEYSNEDKCFVGRVLGIRDVIGFHGESVAELESDFHKTMDFYMETCRKRGKTPEKPHTGKVALRLPPDVHRVVAVESQASGKSVNELISSAVEKTYLLDDSEIPDDDSDARKIVDHIRVHAGYGIVDTKPTSQGVWVKVINLSSERKKHQVP